MFNQLFINLGIVIVVTIVGIIFANFLFKHVIKKESKAYLIYRFFELLPSRTKFYLYLAILIIASFLYFPIPFITKGLVDQGIMEKDLRTIITLTVIFFVLILIMGIYNVFKAKFTSEFIENNIINLKIKLVNHLEKIDDSYLRKNDSGVIIQRLNNDIECSRTILTQVPQIFIKIATLIFGLISILSLNVTLSIITLSLLPVQILYSKKYGNILNKDQKAIIKATEKQLGSITEFAKAIYLVKQYVIDVFETSRIMHVFDIFAKKRVRKAIDLSVMYAILDFISSIGPAIILCYGGYLIIIDEFTLGSLMAFQSLAGFVSGPSMALSNIYVSLKQAMPNLENIFSIMDYETEDENKELPEIKIEQPSIEFKNVSFGIDNNPILKDVSFEIKANTSVAFVGQSGSGKSSILKVIDNFWHPTNGKVLIDQQDIMEFSTESLRNDIVYLAQKPIMLNDTIWNNLTFGADFSKEQVDEFCDLALAKEFIDKLKGGYETILSSDGDLLSGGQIQRLSIARALLHSKKIILIDEGTSALDPESEEHVIQALNKIHGHFTIVSVTHHLEYVRNTDYIYVVDKGRIVDEGTYDKLLESSEAFRNIFRA